MRQINEQSASHEAALAELSAEARTLATRRDELRAEVAALARRNEEERAAVDRAKGEMQVRACVQCLWWLAGGANGRVSS